MRVWIGWIILISEVRRIRGLRCRHVRVHVLGGEVPSRSRGLVDMLRRIVSWYRRGFV